MGRRRRSRRWTRGAAKIGSRLEGGPCRRPRAVLPHVLSPRSLFLTPRSISHVISPRGSVPEHRSDDIHCPCLFHRLLPCIACISVLEYIASVTHPVPKLSLFPPSGPGFARAHSRAEIAIRREFPVVGVPSTCLQVGSGAFSTVLGRRGPNASSKNLADSRGLLRSAFRSIITSLFLGFPASFGHFGTSASSENLADKRGSCEDRDAWTTSRYSLVFRRFRADVGSPHQVRISQTRGALTRSNTSGQPLENLFFRHHVTSSRPACINDTCKSPRLFSRVRTVEILVKDLSFLLEPSRDAGRPSIN